MATKAEQELATKASDIDISSDNNVPNSAPRISRNRVTDAVLQ